MDSSDLEFAILHGLVGLRLFGFKGGLGTSSLFLESIRV